MVKYIFVTGGVLSSVGKGIVTASTALLLKAMGYSVTAIKIDPYVNVDASTMNPYAHGEVFVTEDGGETDLDLGHYERFLHQNLSKNHNITTGKIYLSVIEKERKGEYLGETVQIIPHVTNEIKEKIREVVITSGVDVAVVEIGGTVGDIEGLPFLEAARQMWVEEGPQNVFFVHVGLVPTLSTTGEQKTKPIQHSIQELRRIGIQPNAVIARSQRYLAPEAKRKIALYSSLPSYAVFSNPDVSYIYEVPLILELQGYSRYVASKLNLEFKQPDLESWVSFLNKLKRASKKKKILMVGKYTKLKDSYLSIIEALRHAGAHLGVVPELTWLESTDVERGLVDPREAVERADGVLILPGFGKRGSEGKIEVIRIAREMNKPTLGICFGMQMMVVEFARNVVGLKGANSTELDPHTPYPVIALLKEQENVKYLGGTMRTGAWLINIVKNTKLYDLYEAEYVYERHRHRYEVNPQYVNKLNEHGMVVSAWDSRGEVPEAVELKENKFHLGTQFHPEFKSRPLSPSPVYVGFVSSL